jgi:inhibitor of KinA sporulation pathway (predicted exonuclease)
MNYIVLDLEWNQGSSRQTEETEISFEIVEIGAIKLNENMETLGSFTELVKPQVYHEMHHITGQLIQIQIQDLEQGSVFPEVMTRFLRWCGDGAYIFCTWGIMDLNILQKNMAYYEMPPLSEGPFPFIDLQKLFALARGDRKDRRSLEFAVDYLELEKDIPFHRALDDAYYTAKIMKALAPKQLFHFVSYDAFHPPKDRRSEIRIQFETYQKYISREFADKIQAMEDKEVVSSKCFLCHRNLRKTVRWYTVNAKHYFCVAYCEHHGYLKGKIRLNRSENGGIYVVKTMKLISAQEAETLAKRSEQAGEMRRNRKKRKTNDS